MRTLMEAVQSTRSAKDDPAPLRVLDDTTLLPVLCIEALRGETDAVRWARAPDLVTTVSGMSGDGHTLTATVQGSRSYVVTLAATADRLVGTCTCPCAASDSPRKVLRFCKHTAAVGLAALGWATAPGPGEGVLDTSGLDESALRRVVEAVTSPTEDWSPLDAVRLELVRAGLLSVSDAVAGYTSDPREHWQITPTFLEVHLPDLIAQWNDAQDRADALVAVLEGLFTLLQAGYQVYGDTYGRALADLTRCCSALSAEARRALGADVAGLLVAATDWFEAPGDPGEWTPLVAVLGAEGREGLGDALEVIATAPVPTRPAAAAAQEDWEQDVASHQWRAEQAEALLRYLRR